MPSSPFTQSSLRRDEAFVDPKALMAIRNLELRARLVVEQSGEWTFDAPGGRFTVTAKADRIELREALADILDFKTGRPPSRKQVESGLSPQLTLTAAILRHGGFADAGRREVNQLVYIQVAQFIRQQPGDYDHLARLWEWHVIGEGDSEGGEE